MLTDTDRREPACRLEPAAAPASAEDLRAVARRFARGVSVVSARSGDAVEAMTADTFTTVSLEPPLVLLALAPSGRTCQAIARSGGFAVSVLSSAQEPLARRFAEPSRGRATSLLDELAWSAAPHTGAALLHGAIGWLDCRLRDLVPVAGRALVLGDVVYAAAGLAAPALVRFESAYRGLAPP